jgi:hypothetical protein
MDGYETPADVGRGDIPPKFVRVVAAIADGASAKVWTLTGEPPCLEPYEDDCWRDEHGRRFAASGSGGFSDGTPEWVREKARGMGWRK